MRAWRASTIAAVGIVLICCAPARAGTTIAVTPSSLDVVDGTDGVCSLREAISAATANAASGNADHECPAGSASSPDTVVVPAGTYTLAIGGSHDDANASGDLDVSSSMTIRGAGAATTIIDGGSTGSGPPDRVFDVFGNQVDVTISGLTIRHGQAPTRNDASAAGGGIFNSLGATLTLDSDAVVSNRAGGNSSIAGGDGGGVFNSSTLIVKDSLLSDNHAGPGGSGGAIDSTTFVTVDGSRFSSNTAGSGAGCSGCSSGGAGGAIAATGMTVSGSTFTSNSAGAGGNGPSDGAKGGGGGAIFALGGSVVLAKDTFASNAAGAGAGAVVGGSGGAVELFNTASAFIPGTTFVSNQIQYGAHGAAVYTYIGAFLLANSTVWSNSGGSYALYGDSAQMTLVNDTIAANAVQGFVSKNTTVSNTLVASNMGGNCGPPMTIGGNNLSFPSFDMSCGVLFQHGDPKLAAAPADNGGPTPTLAIGPASAARDVYSGGACAGSDQRGITRPQDARCDIGAFEFATPQVTITTPVDRAHHALGAAVTASYECGEGGVAGFIASCSGPVASGAAIDTSTAGQHSFTVTATDKAGNQATKIVAYTVDAPAGGGGNPAKLTKLKISPSKFRATAGATVSFTLEKAASVRLAIERQAAGRRVGGQCIKPTKKNQNRKPCHRYVALAGHLDRLGVPGANTFHFNGRIGGKKLALGAYRFVVTPQDGTPVRSGFSIVR